MPKYNDIRKYNASSHLGRINRMESSNNNSKSQKDGFNNNRGSLIIDDNTIYEVDDECIERVRKAQSKQRQNWQK